MQLSSWKSIWWFVNCLHHFMTCCMLITPSLYALSTGGEFRWGKYISPINIKLHRELLHGTKFPEYCHCTPVFTMNSIWLTDRMRDWLTLVTSVAYYSLYMCYFIVKSKMAWLTQSYLAREPDLLIMTSIILAPYLGMSYSSGTRGKCVCLPVMMLTTVCFMCCTLGICITSV